MNTQPTDKNLGRYGARVVDLLASPLDIDTAMKGATLIDEMPNQRAIRGGGFVTGLLVALPATVLGYGIATQSTWTFILAGVATLAFTRFASTSIDAAWSLGRQMGATAAISHRAWVTAMADAGIEPADTKGLSQ